MGESTAPPKIYSLRQVARSIKSALERATGNRIWMVRAEIVSVKGTLGTGHVYLDLIDEAQGVKQAAMRAVIWRASGAQIKKELGEELPNVLRSGAEIVFHARVSFHEVFGLSLHIEKIDLSFMLGELERRKQSAIRALTASGELELNRRLPLPRLPQRVAVIGSPGTSGYRDFCTVAVRNPYGIRIDLRVFEARVQGDGAPADLIRALGEAERWGPDVVMLVRGGGSKIDLDCFNDLSLCKRMAAATVPIWTGIGHESDLVVADLVAHTAWKTPTDCANRWIEHCAQTWAAVMDLGQTIGRTAQRHTQRTGQTLADARIRIGTSAQLQLSNRRGILDRTRERIGSLAHAQLTAQQTALHQVAESIATRARRKLQAAELACQHVQGVLESEPVRFLALRNEQLKQMQSTLHAYAVEHTLKRGYAIFRKDGKSITDAASVQAGDRLTVQLHVGGLEVEVVARTPQEERN